MIGMHKIYGRASNVASHMCNMIIHTRRPLQDAIAVWRELYHVERPPIVLVGHSMGGAIAVRCAASKVCL